MTTFTQTELETLSLHAIAKLIQRDWKNVNYAAKPYLDAMHQLRDVQDTFGLDDGSSIVRYFLGNATSWRGETARNVKAELKRRLK
jgi:hypothetical protein